MKMQICRDWPPSATAACATLNRRDKDQQRRGRDLGLHLNIFISSTDGGCHNYFKHRLLTFSTFLNRRHRSMGSITSGYAHVHNWR
jgi:hypothetical protein